MITAQRERTKVVVADDHTLFRHGLVELISAGEGLEVVGEAGTGQKTIEMVISQRPDVLLLDVEMPGPGVHATIAELTRTCPKTKIIIVTMHDDANLLYELLECGAAAYLVKNIARAELLAALYAVGGDGDNVLVSVSRETMDRLNNKRAEQVVLSGREREVLRLLAQAMTNSQIATRLFIAEATVKRHLTNIYAKLGAASRMDAIRKAISAGLLEGLVDHWGTL